MYSNKMVACLKANGKVLREFNDTVYVPFGQEYNILLKNLNSVKALVNITIDGEDVVPGGLVVDGNREIELERFVKDMSKGNRFKFIKRTAGIEQHRGIKADDGIIRISFKYERRQPAWTNNDWNTMKLGGSWGGGYNPDPHWYGTTNAIGSAIPDSAVVKSAVLRGMPEPTMTYSANAVASASDAQLMNVATTQSLAGITAPGSVSNQKFQTASWFPTEVEEHVVVMHLLGETETGKKVAQPVTVKHQPVCKMCGHKNKAKARFCSECGSGLELV